VFNLFAIDGYSHTEIVEQLNIPLGTSKWHVSNARKLMKEYIENTENKTLKNEMVG
jgi:RNA polymerase sigma-70 factor (ECF subfamily)